MQNMVAGQTLRRHYLKDSERVSRNLCQVRFFLSEQIFPGCPGVEQGYPYSRNYFIINSYRRIGFYM